MRFESATWGTVDVEFVQLSLRKSARDFLICRVGGLYLDAANVFVVSELWDKELCDHINDASLVGTEAGSEFGSIQLASFSVLLVKHCFAASTEGSRLACLQQLTQSLQTCAILAKIQGGAFAGFPKSHLDVISEGCCCCHFELERSFRRVIGD